LLILVGALYRLAAFGFFLAFTYVELIDISNYLNHYYFVSVLALLLVFLPANARLSVDAWLWPRIRRTHAHRWQVLVPQAQLAVVYFFAGVAKLNPDWLLEALPLRIWLPPHNDLPVVGPLFAQPWLAYAFSWFGCIYDLAIPFLLGWGRTRPWAYIAVVVFHVATWLLFPIGVFPWVMIFSTLVFFSSSWHERWLAPLERLLRIRPRPVSLPRAQWTAKVALGLLLLHFTVQVLLPFRYLLFEGPLFWTEEGFRFSWRVMLVEKAGAATFYVHDPQTGQVWEAAAENWLAPHQAKQMAFQPDMLLQMAHHLKRVWQERGIPNPEIRAKVYVRLQNQPSRLLLDPTIDLAQVHDPPFSFRSRTGWVLHPQYAPTLTAATQ
jgi:hypothetical protein